MRPQNPKYALRVKKIFESAPFIQALGIQFKDCGPGWCEAFVKASPSHYQQNNVIHAGVLTTLADHTGGGAAGTLIQENEIVLTVEFNINLLRPADEETIFCRAKVLRPGRRISVVESEVFGLRGYQRIAYAKAMVTLVVLEESA